MSATVSWKKMASCGKFSGDWPGMAPQSLAGMWGSKPGRMRRRRMVQTILTSVTARTMGRQLSGLAQSPLEGADNVCQVWWQGGLPRDDVPEAVGEDAEEVGGEVVVCLCREAVIAWVFVLPETVDGPPDFVDGEGALLQLPPLDVVEDLREAVDFGLGFRVQCVSGGCVLLEEAVFAGFVHGGWVVRERAVLLPDSGDGAVGGVCHGVAEVADGLVGEFVLRIPFVLSGDALLPVDVPLLQVCPDAGYLRPAVVDVAAGWGVVGVEEGRQLLLRMPEVMEHVPQGRGRSVVLGVGVLLEPAGDSGWAHGCE